MKLFDVIPVPNYLEPTVNVTFFAGDMFYVMKDETCVEGPWDEREGEKLTQYIPRQYRGKLEQLYPFQKRFGIVRILLTIEL